MVYIIGLYGLLLGSFYNVVGLRVPVQRSIIKPRSRCNECSHTLSPIELIPVFSFILLGGKCKKCKANISILYPLMEVITAVVFIGIYLQSTSVMEFLFGLILVSFLVILTVSDINYQLVPDKILLFFTPTMVFFALYLTELAWVNHFLTGVITFIFFFLLALLTKGGIGGGDVKLFGILGLIFGFVDFFIIFILTFSIASIVGVLLKLKDKDLKGLPLVPFITVSTFLVLFFNMQVVLRLLFVWV